MNNEAGGLVVVPLTSFDLVVDDATAVLGTVGSRHPGWFGGTVRTHAATGLVVDFTGSGATEPDEEIGCRSGLTPTTFG